MCQSHQTIFVILLSTVTININTNGIKFKRIQLLNCNVKNNIRNNAKINPSLLTAKINVKIYMLCLVTFVIKHIICTFLAGSELVCRHMRGCMPQREQQLNAVLPFMVSK